MADHEKLMRNAIVTVIISVNLAECWFYFCKCLVTLVGDCDLMKFYKDKANHALYEHMRCYLMLPLLRDDFIKFACDTLLSLAGLNMPEEGKNGFDKFIKCRKQTWLDGLHDVDEWCAHDHWIRIHN